MVRLDVDIDVDSVLEAIDDLSRSELNKVLRKVNYRLYGHQTTYETRTDENEVQFVEDTLYDYYTNKVLKQLSEKYTLEELESFLKIK